MRTMTKILLAGAAAFLVAMPAQAQSVVFLSTQLRPIEEAQKVRDVLLKGGPATQFVTEEPARLNTRVEAEAQAGTRSFSLIGALHGEISGLPPAVLDPVDDIMAKLKDRGMPDAIAALGKLGGDKQLYIPWMQATYVMAANKQALKHLPAGADINALTYEQLGAWAEAVRKATGERKLGFPAGPTGLMARFFQGYLYPSYTGGVVSTFKSAEAEQMWGAFKALWAHVNPASTATTSCRSPWLRARCGSPSTISPGSRTRCRRSPTISSRSPPPPVRRAAASCRSSPASRCRRARRTAPARKR